MRIHPPHVLCEWQPLILVLLLGPLAGPLYADDAAAIQQTFQQQVEPFVKDVCLRCHNEEERESGIRLDQLDGGVPESRLKLWEGIRRQIAEEAMPPEDEPQPTERQRQQVLRWIDRALDLARSRDIERNGSLRRLTVRQYRNTLRELLGTDEDFASVLPPDGISKEGFTNNAEVLLTSPLQVEAWLEIAEKALDACIVDESSVPMIQSFRMELGREINPQPLGEELILGAFNHLLKNSDFVVSQFRPDKSFPFQPLAMRTKYRFNEGYQGNDTVRGMREFDSIYHAVFACMRGDTGYPKGDPYVTVPQGLLLRPAIPTTEIFGESSTYGPKANFKIAHREMPDHGRFRVRVRAAKYHDGLLLAGLGFGPADRRDDEAQIVLTSLGGSQVVEIPRAGVYQIDVFVPSPDEKPKDDGDQKSSKSNKFSLTIDDRPFSTDDPEPAFLVLDLTAGEHVLAVDCQGGIDAIEKLVFTRLADSHKAAKQLATFQKRIPNLGVHVGLRRDCGDTSARVGKIQAVANTELQEFIFEGAINNYPLPHLQEDNDNYLAGVYQILVRSEFTDDRDMPRLLIRSVEFEGPLFDQWPPETHRRVFVESANRDRPEIYAREIIQSFASRAYRRDVTDQELQSLLQVWDDSFAESGQFTASIKQALMVVLSSPQFLFLSESSLGPHSEPLDPWELASKLSYFLWNAPPDKRLRQLARSNHLHDTLDHEIDRMIDDPRLTQFVDEFTPQWLRLDRFDVVETDRKAFPRLTTHVRQQLRHQPARLFQHLIEQNLPVRCLIDANFVVANETVANYYELGDRCESRFDFVAIEHDDPQLGGLLSQAAILAGLSNGRDANPVKRGAWFARKIIATPPDDPPPNVPELEDRTDLSLRERLRQHRDVKGCAKCHEGIDPWGLPFEQFDAGGRFAGEGIDASSTLPDGTKVQNLNDLRAYLLGQQLDQVAYGVAKHLATYAIGRRLTYNEDRVLRQKCLELASDDYPMRDLIRMIITSDLFLKK